MKNIILIFVFGLLARITVSLDYLTEKPDYLGEACSIKSPEFSKCSIVNLQNVFNQLKTGEFQNLLNRPENWAKKRTNSCKGIPGLKILPKIDPYYIKRVKLLQNNDAAKFDIELAKLTAIGFGNAVIKENLVNEKDYSWRTKFFLPKLHVNGDYKVNGKILALALKGAGDFFIDMENVDLKMLTKVKLYEKGGNTFGNVTNCKVEFKIGGLKLKLNNLFNGQTELEESMNTLLNESWMDFLEAMRPAFNQMVEAILLDNMRKVFHYVPAKYFISDIPTSQELYQ